jgi:hypothetical protein
MPTDYVEDYEEVTGKKPDGSPLETEVVTKVVTPPAKAEPKTTPAKTKAVKTKAVKAK